MKKKIPQYLYNQMLTSTDGCGSGDLTLDATEVFTPFASFHDNKTVGRAFGNLWDRLKTIELLYEWGGDYTADHFNNIWDDAADLDLVNVSGQPEVWQYFGATYDEPSYDEPIEAGCEEVMNTVRRAIVEAIYEVEDA